MRFTVASIKQASLGLLVPLALAACASPLATGTPAVTDGALTSTPTAAERLSAPQAFVHRESAPDCGTETVVRGEGWNVEARQCFFDAYRQGRAAEFTSTTEWVEGQIVTAHLRSLGAGEAEIWFDPSGDQTQVRWSRQTGCAFHAAEEYVHAPGTGDPVFVQACHGEGDIEEPSRLIRTDEVSPPPSSFSTVGHGLS